MNKSIKTYVASRRFLNSVVGSCLALGACFSQAKAETVPIAVGIDPAFVAFFVAEQQGLFEKRGVDVDLITFGPGGQMVDGMTAGQAVMSASTETTHIVRMAHSDIRALSMVGVSGDNLKLVSSSSIASPSDIKKLGVVPGGVFAYLSNLGLAKFGIDPATVEIVNSAPPELPALLARGDIDAFWLFEPFPTMVVNQQGGRVLAHSKDVGYNYNFWVSAMGPWLQENEDAARKVLQALGEACEVITANPQIAAEAVKAQVKIPTAQTLDFLKEVQCVVRDFSDEELRSYDDVAAYLATANITPKLVEVRKQIMTGFLNN